MSKVTCTGYIKPDKDDIACCYEDDVYLKENLQLFISCPFYYNGKFHNKKAKMLCKYYRPYIRRNEKS